MFKFKNGDEPEYIYKFNYEDKIGLLAGKGNFHNAVGMEERKENSQMIEELIEIVRKDWPKSPPAPSTTHEEVNVLPPPPPPQHNVDSGGASSSQSKIDTSHLKIKEKMYEENPPPPEPKSVVDHSEGKIEQIPPSPASQSVDSSSGATSSQPKSGNLKMKEKIEEIPPSFKPEKVPSNQNRRFIIGGPKELHHPQPKEQKHNTQTREILVKGNLIC
jgi:hypothetical protein